MKGSSSGKWIIILVLIGVIVLAVLWRKQKMERRNQQIAGMIPATISRVDTGAIPLTGSPESWESVTRYPVWEESEEGGRPTDWRAVRLAHDGEMLYAMVNLAYPLMDRAPEKKGTLIVGQLRLDTDQDAGTGSPLGEGPQALGIDRQVTIVARRKGEDAPLCVGYFVERCRKTGRPEQIGEWVTTCSGPDRVGYEGQHVSLGVALEKIDALPPADVTFAFEPFGGSGIKQYELNLR